jgi:hypothetical protein
LRRWWVARSSSNLLENGYTRVPRHRWRGSTLDNKRAHFPGNFKYSWQDTAVPPPKRPGDRPKRGLRIRPVRQKGRAAPIEKADLEIADGSASHGGALVDRGLGHPACLTTHVNNGVQRLERPASRRCQGLKP